jgi:hypothetical protein
MRIRLVVLAGLLLVVASPPSLAAAGAPRQAPLMILALGNTGYLNPTDIQAATGAAIKQDMEKFELKDFAVVVLANVAFAALPGPVQQGLVQYVNDGGAVLITGGAQSFGSGGYQAVTSLLPFQLRSNSDWRFTSFRVPVPLQAGHPILAGVTFIPVGTLNDMNPRPDATEILQAAGGGVAGPRYPLIAEVGSGSGRVLGIAFDLNDFAGMRDRDLFVRNTITYLLRASRMGPAR